MGTSPEFISFIVDQLKDAGRIRARKMFGEYAIYHYDKMVALVCDNRLYIKSTDAGKAFLGKGNLAAPYPGASLHIVMDDPDDAGRLCELVKITAKALPEPKKKKK